LYLLDLLQSPLLTATTTPIMTTTTTTIMIMMMRLTLALVVNDRHPLRKPNGHFRQDQKDLLLHLLLESQVWWYPVKRVLALMPVSVSHVQVRRLSQLNLTLTLNLNLNLHLGVNPSPNPNLNPNPNPHPNLHLNLGSKPEPKLSLLLKNPRLKNPKSRKNKQRRNRKKCETFQMCKCEALKPLKKHGIRGTPNLKNKFKMCPNILP
jgi:hypothetical protein